MFKVTPKKTLYGKKLKRFYRAVYYIMGHPTPSFLPPDWSQHPYVLLNQQQLNRLFNCL